MPSNEVILAVYANGLPVPALSVEGLAVYAATVDSPMIGASTVLRIGNCWSMPITGDANRPRIGMPVRNWSNWVTWETRMPNVSVPDVRTDTSGR